MKKVLVIEDKEENLAKTVKALACMGIDVGVLPGPLLAEFEGSVYKKDLTDAQAGGQQTLQIVGDKMGKTNYREVTVLILEGEKNEATV